MNFFLKMTTVRFCFAQVLTAFTFTFVLMFPLTKAWALNVRFVTSDLTVTDKVTGLTWTRNANPAGRQMSWNNASEYIKILNKEAYGGYSDWVLPEIENLKKLFIGLGAIARNKPLKGEQAIAAFQSLGFENVEAGDYWSATGSFYNDSEAWFMNMADGIEFSGNKSLYHFVWPVRFEKKVRQINSSSPKQVK